MRKHGIGLAALIAVALVGLSPLAAAPAIPRGVDTFTTNADGGTYYDFAQNPIPAGFFCKSSPAFTGRVVLRGVPLATEVPGQLHGADTVIERLDDASFDDDGVATTRLRFKALSLASVRPIQTGCGAFHVFVSLADKQRTTTMRIFQTHEQGGHFSAPLAVNARMSFVPVRAGKAARRLELTGSFTFPATPLSWMQENGPQAKRLGGSARIDTDGDQKPDSLVFEAAGFAPGWSPENLVQKAGQRLCEPRICHTDPATGKEHCSGPIYTCGTCACP